MPEREFDGQLAITQTQSALVQAAHDKLVTLARKLDFVPYNAPRPDLQSAPGSRSQAAQPSPSVMRARK